MKNIDTTAIIEALQNAEKNENQFNALLQSVKKAKTNLENSLGELDRIIVDAESGNLQVKRRGGSVKGAKRGRKPKSEQE